MEGHRDSEGLGWRALWDSEGLSWRDGGTRRVLFGGPEGLGGTWSERLAVSVGSEGVTNSREILPDQVGSGFGKVFVSQLFYVNFSKQGRFFSTHSSVKSREGHGSSHESSHGSGHGLDLGSTTQRKPGRFGSKHHDQWAVGHVDAWVVGHVDPWAIFDPWAVLTRGPWAMLFRHDVL